MARLLKFTSNRSWDASWSGWHVKEDNENYNSKKEDLEEEDQGEDERNVIL